MAAATRGGEPRGLLANVLLVAVCALVYELLCGAAASYLFGDAVVQFSLVLGTYLFAMGAGSYAAKWLEPEAATRYVEVELLLALVGGLAVPAIFLAAARGLPIRAVLHGVVFVIGALVGAELPLLIRILRDRAGEGAFKDTIARALAFDYLGALVASLLFPLALVPHLGLVGAGVATGATNAIVALSATFLVDVKRPAIARGLAVAVLGLLLVAHGPLERLVRASTD